MSSFVRSAPSNARGDALRVVAAGLCGLVAAYWVLVGRGSRFGYISSNFDVLIGVLGLGCIVAALAATGARFIAPLASALRVIGLATGIFALAHGWLLYQWIHGDGERYVWVIHQAQPCSAMGGGPGGLFVLMTSAVFALAALVYALRGGLTSAQARSGVGLAIALAAITALAMFPDPTVYARVLGCV